MADTKVSGLSAAASFLTTHEIPVNEGGVSKKVTGAQIKAVLAGGSLGYQQVIANQGTYTTVVDLTSLTVTTPVLAAGRRLKITGQIMVQSTVADDIVGLNVQEGATILSIGQVTCRVTAQPVSLYVSAVVQPSAVAHTYKLTSVRATGTGLITMAAGGTFPAFILVEDVGT